LDREAPLERAKAVARAARQETGGVRQAAQVVRRLVAKGNDKRLFIDGIPALANNRRRHSMMLGFVGLALRRRGVEADLNDMGSDQGPSEPEAELAQTQVADRKARLEEQKRDRWADRDRGTKKSMARNRNDRLCLRQHQ
jgi:hypothetical protein